MADEAYINEGQRLIKESIRCRAQGPKPNLKQASATEELLAEHLVVKSLSSSERDTQSVTTKIDFSVIISPYFEQYQTSTSKTSSPETALPDHVDDTKKNIEKKYQKKMQKVDGRKSSSPKPTDEGEQTQSPPLAYINQLFGHSKELYHSFTEKAGPNLAREYLADLLTLWLRHKDSNFPKGHWITLYAGFMETLAKGIYNEKKISAYSIDTAINLLLETAEIKKGLLKPNKGKRDKIPRPNTTILGKKLKKIFPALEITTRINNIEKLYGQDKKEFYHRLSSYLKNNRANILANRNTAYNLLPTQTSAMMAIMLGDFNYAKKTEVKSEITLEEREVIAERYNRFQRCLQTAKSSKGTRVKPEDVNHIKNLRKFCYKHLADDSAKLKGSKTWNEDKWINELHDTDRRARKDKGFWGYHFGPLAKKFVAVIKSIASKLFGGGGPNFSAMKKRLLKLNSPASNDLSYSNTFRFVPKHKSSFYQYRKRLYKEISPNKAFIFALAVGDFRTARNCIKKGSVSLTDIEKNFLVSEVKRREGASQYDKYLSKSSEIKQTRALKAFCYKYLSYNHDSEWTEDKWIEKFGDTERAERKKSGFLRYHWNKLMAKIKNPWQKPTTTGKNGIEQPIKEPPNIITSFTRSLQMFGIAKSPPIVLRVKQHPEIDSNTHTIGRNDEDWVDDLLEDDCKAVPVNEDEDEDDEEEKFQEQSLSLSLSNSY